MIFFSILALKNMENYSGLKTKPGKSDATSDHVRALAVPMVSLTEECLTRKTMIRVRIITLKTFLKYRCFCYLSSPL